MPPPLLNNCDPPLMDLLTLQIILETAHFLGKEKKNNIKEIISIVVNCGILFQINDDPATPYIESQPMDASLDNAGSVVNDSVVNEQVVQRTGEVQLNVGCSGIDLNSPDIVKIEGTYSQVKFDLSRKSHLLRKMRMDH